METEKKNNCEGICLIKIVCKESIHSSKKKKGRDKINIKSVKKGILK